MLKKFEGEKRKQYMALGIAVVVLGGGVLLLSYLFTSGGQSQAPKPPPPKIETPSPQKIEQEAFKKEYGEKLLEIEKRLEQIERRQDTTGAPSFPPPLPPSAGGPPPAVFPPPPPSSFPPPPPPSAEQTQQTQMQAQQVKPQVLSDLIALEGERKKEEKKEEKKPEEKPEEKKKPKGSVIPAGSFVRGILLSGLDAPTGGRAQSQPHPVLIRIVDRAVLPNLFKADIRDCFVIGAGYGDLASERAYIRLEALSCVKKSGEVVERKVQGFVAGEDGKVGLHGRVVSKQGQVLARMLLAGFIEGISRIFQQSGTTVIVSPTGGTTTQTIDPSMALRTGLAGGMASATKELVEFYKKLAEETYPVVEINAGRNVDLVFLQSIDFSSESRQAQTIREEEQGILRVNRPQQEGQ